MSKKYSMGKFNTTKNIFVISFFILILACSKDKQEVIDVEIPEFIIPMVYVPEGEVLLGLTSNPKTKIDSFYIGKYEISQSEWQKVMNENKNGISNRPSLFANCGENCPVDNVSWYEAIVFCNTYSILKNREPVYNIDGSTNPSNWGASPGLLGNTKWNNVKVNWAANGYRLPTEAEWEYAATVPSNNNISIWSGTSEVSNLYKFANFCDLSCSFSLKEPDYNDGFTNTSPSGKFMPNALGIYDMSGNVWEWCWDWRGLVFPTTSNNPKGPITGSSRIVRGGSWINLPDFCKNNLRNDVPPGTKTNANGFRIVSKIK